MIKQFLKKLNRFHCILMGGHFKIFSRLEGKIKCAHCDWQTKGWDISDGTKISSMRMLQNESYFAKKKMLL